MPEKILIADDDIRTLKLVGLVLDRNGYDVIVAQSGAQALEKIESEVPDLTILDIMMPRMNGYEVTRRLRANPDTAEMPVLLFTGRAQAEDKVAGIEAGASDYVTKPIHPDELLTRVQALLERPRPSQAEDEGPPVNVIGFLGSKGGVGTTTLAVNTAAILAQGQDKNRRVVLAELREGMATAALQLGLPRKDGIEKILSHPSGEIDAELVEAQLDQHSTGLLVLSGTCQPSGIVEPISADHAEAIIQQLGSGADYLLVDLGTGLGEVNRRILPCCCCIVVAVEPDGVSQTLAKELLDQMEHSLGIPKRKITLVLIKRSRSAASLSAEGVEEALGHDVIGLIPPAPELALQSTEENKPMVVIDADGAVAERYRTVAEVLMEIL